MGGSTAYDGTTNRLATTSGGAASVAAITSADTVTFDTNSGAAAVTTSAAIACSAMTLAAGFTGSLTMSNPLTVSGAVTLTQGTLNTNGQACSWGSVKLGAGTKTLTLGSSVITITGAGATVVDFTTNGANFTFNAGTSSITFNGGSNATMDAGNKAFYDVTSDVHGQFIANPLSFHNLTQSGGAFSSVSYEFGGSFTVTGVHTVAGFSAVNRAYVQSHTLGTTRTITAAATSYTNVDFMDIAGAGAAAPFTGTSLGDAQGNSGITFAAAVDQYRIGAGGNWSDATHWSLTSGGAANGRVPLPQDNAHIDGNATGTVTADMPRLGANVDFTGFAGTWAINTNTAWAIYGGLTLSAGMSIIGSVSAQWNGRGAYTVTTNGKVLPCSVDLFAPGGTYTLQDDLTISGTTHFGPQNGTLSTGGHNLTIGAWTAGASSTLIGAGSTITLYRTDAIGIWSQSGAVTSAPTNIVISAASVNTRTFAGGGKTYGTLTYTVAGSTGALVITGANTFAAIQGAGDRTITFPASTTTTITDASGLAGTSGHLLTLNSSTPGTAATLTGVGLNQTFLTLTDIAVNVNGTATGDAATDTDAVSTLALGTLGNIKDSTATADAVKALALGTLGNVTDACALTDTAVPLIPIAGIGDNSSVDELARLFDQLTLYETAASADAAGLLGLPNGSDASTATDQAPSMLVSLAELASVADIARLLGLPVSADVAAGTEDLALALGTADRAVAVDAAALGVQGPMDSAVATDRVVTFFTRRGGAVASRSRGGSVKGGLE